MKEHQHTIPYVHECDNESYTTISDVDFGSNKGILFGSRVYAIRVRKQAHQAPLPWRSNADPMINVAETTFTPASTCLPGCHSNL
jgi:hypothetical protein